MSIQPTSLTVMLGDGTTMTVTDPATIAAILDPGPSYSMSCEYGTPPSNSYEADIIAKHSTPGLRRNELTRDGKRDQLAGLKASKEEIDLLLGKLYK